MSIKLSKIGRYNICRMIGINNKNSIFVKNEEAFEDRINLYNTIYDIDKLIKTYTEELNSFNNEDEYNDFIEKGIEKVSDIINNKVHELITNKEYVYTDFFQYGILHQMKTEVNEIDDESHCYLRIYPETLKFASFNNILPSELNFGEDTLSDFIFKTTNSKFLALAEDIDFFNLNNIAIRIIEASTNLFSMLILKYISPMYLNSNNLIKCGDGIIEFKVSENKTVKSLCRLYNDINDLGFPQKINVEMFKYNRLANNHDIKLRIDIFPVTKTELFNVKCNDKLVLHEYLRKIRNEKKSKYDNYIHADGIEYKALNSNKIYWK